MTDSQDGMRVQYDLTAAFYPAHRASTDPEGREFKADAHTYFPSPHDLGLDSIGQLHGTHLPNTIESGGADEPEIDGTDRPVADAAEQSQVADQQRPWWATLLGITGIFIVINVLALLFGALFF